MDVASRLPEAKKGMPLDALWVSEFFKVLVHGLQFAAWSTCHHVLCMEL